MTEQIPQWAVERARELAALWNDPGQEDAIACALADAAKPKWRADLENAPKDGSTFWAAGWDFGVVGGSRHVVCAKWSEDEGDFVEVGEETDCLLYLTHWADLPAEPEME